MGLLERILVGLLVACLMAAAFVVKELLTSFFLVLLSLAGVVILLIRD